MKLLVGLVVALAACGGGSGRPPADAGPGPGEVWLIDDGEIDPKDAPAGFGVEPERVGQSRRRVSAVSPDGDVTLEWIHQGEIKWRCGKGCKTDVRESDEVRLQLRHGEAPPTGRQLEVGEGKLGKGAGPFVLAAGSSQLAVIGGGTLRVWPRDGSGEPVIVELVAMPRLAAWVEGALVLVTGDLDVTVLDAAAGFVERARWQAGGKVAAIAARPDGQSVALAIPAAIVVHAPDGTVRGRAAIAAPVTALRWSRGGDQLLVASPAGERIAVRRFRVR